VPRLLALEFLEHLLLFRWRSRSARNRLFLSLTTTAFAGA
jgi:hypothetical protein